MHTSLDLLTRKILGELVLNAYRRDLSLYLRISEYLKNKILQREIPEGASLPSTRVLAEYLKVSRSTAIKAYDILLLEGLIEVRHGARYRVKKNMQDDVLPDHKVPADVTYPEISEKGRAFKENVHLINTTSEEAIAFRPGLPPLDIFPVNQWKKLSNYYWRTIKASSLSYSNSSGVEVLKRNLAGYLNMMRGIRCDYEQIIIVSGSLQSLYLLGNALMDRGDTMVMENPTFPNVHSIFRSLEANIIAASIDREGICIPQADEVSARPKLIHITPSGHYPTGVKMSPQRKSDLLRWASENGSIIIENDYEHEISNWGLKDPSVFSMDTEQRTVYLGTFNRLLHPSIRLGYMVVPYYLLDTIKALQNHSHRFVSPSNQVVMNQFIEKNYLYHHIKNVIEVAEERKALFSGIVRNEFHPSFQLADSPARSLHLLGNFELPVSDQPLIRRFKERHLIAHAYSKCFISGQQNGLILGYAAVRKPLIPKKLSEMASIYNKMIKEVTDRTGLP
ncbi:PLP-dependent aminotransferase family protein [Sinomicrobium pectinilyticum]|uniref:PLP-dependent aminotransferase family protein n=1 Tax=Sinomicrobium pectinilyticum TaxID=1084421 RepID=A0A3N0E2R4_SINP1|nr:PLP-dependent aminotransferase family protein [Sinomicrobium pectinilyticum]RNL82073.1 PLP-dependent aminotransferase family protein [Sinomicrobium pectinilyticum]